MSITKRGEHLPCLWRKRKFPFLTQHWPTLVTAYSFTIICFILSCKKCVWASLPVVMSPHIIFKQKISRRWAMAHKNRVLHSQNCSRVCSLILTSPSPSCLSSRTIEMCKPSPSVESINLKWWSVYYILAIVLKTNFANNVANSIPTQHIGDLLKYKTQLYQCNLSFWKKTIPHNILAPV